MKRKGQPNAFEARLVNLIFSRVDAIVTDEIKALKKKVKTLEKEKEEYMDTIEHLRDTVDISDSEEREQKVPFFCNTCQHTRVYGDFGGSYCPSCFLHNVPCKKWCVEKRKEKINICSVCGIRWLCSTCTICLRCTKKRSEK